MHRTFPKNQRMQVSHHAAGHPACKMIVKFRKSRQNALKTASKLLNQVTPRDTEKQNHGISMDDFQPIYNCMEENQQ